ncbi:MAG: serine/threonine kinase [Thermus sp.]
MVLDDRYRVVELLAEAGPVRVYRAVASPMGEPREDPEGTRGLLVWYEVHTPEAREAFYRYRAALKRLSELGLSAVLSAKPGRYYAFFPEKPLSQPSPEVKRRALEALAPFGFSEKHLGFSENQPAYLTPLPLEKPRPRRTWNWTRVIPGIALFSAGVFLFGMGFVRYFNPKEVVVPELVGKTALEAYTLLKDTGLNVEVREGNDPDKPKELVLDQNPPPGERLKVGRTLVLVLNQALPTPVPDLVGKPLELARSLLEEAGFALGQVSRVESQAPVGTVLASLPPPGSPAKKGQVVHLLLSQGPQKAADTQMPNLLGLTKDQALFLLNAAGLQAEVREVPSGAPSGLVLSQSPPAGTPLASGSGVRIAVSVQPEVQLPPEPQGYAVTLSFTLPPEAEGREVRLTLVDARGEHVLFEGQGQAGLPLSGRYTAFGEARLRLYLDGVLYREWAP